ncbi:RodZ family helix-turn-helix domain-containing protein [Paenibacillus cisolokensis]|uniref:helix-turn-helix domain-containing protein n=1 Tax=Paenibacillus cisolokensis TaxID=1658519 RepID=UPI003D289CEC
MSELGQQLREARLQKGMSLDDVQEITKIRKRYLEAIEAGDYKVLPGSFYVRAFIKTYAEAVGINPDELLEGHKQDVPRNEPESTMEPVIQKRASRSESSRSMSWLPTLLMWTFPILIIAVIYWYASGANNPKTDPPPATNPPVTQEEPADQGENNPDGETSGDQEGGGAGAEEPGTDAAGGETESVDEPEEPVGQATVTQDRTEGNRTFFKVAGAGVKVEISASSDGKSWVEVYRGTNSQGERLYFDNLENGASVSYDLDGQGMYIKSGYSAATTITVGGHEVTDGKTTSRIVLEAADASTETDTNGE